MCVKRTDFRSRPATAIWFARQADGRPNGVQVVLIQLAKLAAAA